MAGRTGLAQESAEPQRYVAGNEDRADDSATMTVTAALSPSYSRLTHDNAALLLIDHQIGPLWELEFSASRRRVVELAKGARRLGVPTIVTAIAPETWGPIIPELSAVHADDRVIVRSVVNAWDDARVRRAIESTGRSKLIIAGSAIEVAVALCALAAVGAGYEVYAPIDASGQSSHRALVRLSQAGVVVTTTSLVANEMSGERARDGTTPGHASSAEHVTTGELLKRRLRLSRRSR